MYNKFFVSNDGWEIQRRLSKETPTGLLELIKIKKENVKYRGQKNKECLLRGPEAWAHICK